MSKIKPPFGSLPIWTPERQDMALDLAILGPNDLRDYSKPNPPIAGTNNGATPVITEHGPALSFDGVSNVNLPEISTASTENVTIHFRAKVYEDALDNYGMVFGLLPSATNYIWLRTNQYFRIKLNDGETYNWNETVIKLGLLEMTDYTIVLSNTDQIISLYTNGVFFSSKALTAPSAFNINSIGSSYAANNFSLDGEVVLVKIFNWALSAPEIKQVSDNPWQDWRKDNILWMAAAQGGGTPATGSVNLLDGLFKRKRLIA